MSASKGKVKFMNSEKGFGFIIDDLTGIEIFVHVSAINEPITENDRVQFDVTDGKKGKNAINVQKI